MASSWGGKQGVGVEAYRSSGTAWQVKPLPLGVQLKPTAQKGKVSSPSSFGAPQTAPCPPEQNSSELLPLTGTSQM